MNWKPLAGHVIIKSHKEEKTDSGLFIPESAQKNVGEVVAATEGYHTPHGYFVKAEVKVGDIVYLPHNAEQVDLDGEKLYVCHEAELKLSK